MKRSLSARPAVLAAVALLAAMPLNSCNVFDPFDGPTGDEQLLSAARACFDQGDLVCARENYGKLSSASANTMISETAFAILDENGASMAALMQFAGEGGGGAALTTFAESMAKKAANQSVRTALHTAYLKHTEIVGNDDLKNFVKFVSALAIAAEVLGEVAGADGVLSKTDIAASAACSGSNLGACGAGTSSITNVAYPVDNLDSSATAPNSSTPTWGYVDAALNKAQAALSALGAGGDFGSTGNAFSVISTIDPSAAAANFRGALIDNGIGR